MSDKRFIGKQMNRMNRGRFFLNFGIFFFTGMIFLKDYLPQIRQDIATVVSILIGTFGSWSLGYLDEKKLKAWQEQLRHLNEINPFLSEMKSDIKDIKEVVIHEN